MLFLVEVSQALLDWLRTGLDVEGLLSDIPGDTRHFGWAPCKHVSIALEEVDEIAFLFGVQTSLDLHGFGWFPSIDLCGLGILVYLERTRQRGHHRAEQHRGKPEAELP
jgi:hypothetical protein